MLAIPEACDMPAGKSVKCRAHAHVERSVAEPPVILALHSEMDPPNVDVDIEAQNQAQTNDIPETPKIATNEHPPPPNTTNPQPATNADPHHQAAGLNEIPNLKTPAPKTTSNSDVLRGISTSLVHNL